MKYGFVYIWYDRKHKRYYVGCHWGQEDDGYICSSNWMRMAYTRRPEDFKRRILKRTTIRELLFELEDYYLNMIPNEEFGKRYYNLQNNWKHWSEKEQQRLSISQKISQSRKGNKYGPRSEETKQKIREANLGKILSEETKQKISQANLGKTISDKQRQAISKANKGIPRSDEVKKKISESKRNKNGN